VLTPSSRTSSPTLLQSSSQSLSSNSSSQVEIVAKEKNDLKIENIFAPQPPESQSQSLRKTHRLKIKAADEDESEAEYFGPDIDDEPNPHIPISLPSSMVSVSSQIPQSQSSQSSQLPQSQTSQTSEPPQSQTFESQSKSSDSPQSQTSEPPQSQTSQSPTIESSTPDIEEDEQTAAEAKLNGCKVNITKGCSQSIPSFNIPTGCGFSIDEKFVNALVGENLKSKFHDCCSSHNLCYGTLGSNKDDCDYKFFHCTLASCKGWLCKAKAYGYYQTVSEGGCPSFERAQISLQCKQ